MLNIKTDRLLSLSLSLPPPHQFYHIPFYRLKYHLFNWFSDDGHLGCGCAFPNFGGVVGVVCFLFSNNTANNICHFQCIVSVYLQDKFPDWNC